MEKMNVCFISREYPPQSHAGGIGTYTYVAATALSRRGHRVHVICVTAEMPEETIEQGVCVHRIPVHDFLLPGTRPFYPVRRLARKFLFQFLEYQAWSYGAARALDALRRKENIQVVEYAETNAEGYFVGRAEGIPRVCRLHIGGAMESASNLGGHRISRSLTARIERRSVLAAAAITCPSHSLADETSRRLRIPWERIVVFPNPLDPLFTDTPPSRKGRFDQRLLFVGRVERRKGTEILLGAFVNLLHRYPQSRLRIVGQDYGHYFDPMRKRDLLQYLLDKYEIRHRVEFLPRLERALLLDQFAWADAVVVPSINENLPYVVLEAMSQAKLVLASDCGGIPEIITHHKNGLLFTTADIASLTQALMEVWEDPGMIEPIGCAAREEVIAKYSTQAILPHLERVYQEAAAK